MKKFIFLLVLCLASFNMYANENVPVWVQTSVNEFRTEVSGFSHPVLGGILFFVIFIVTGLIIASENKGKAISKDIYVCWGFMFIGPLLCVLKNPETFIFSVIGLGLIITGTTTGSLIGCLIFKKKLPKEKEHAEVGGDMRG